ncbi:MAG: 23S rRNA (uracil(1939)-C(5))-methyltransferase RlmD [Defluviitaleaceae bacterium]|nr:23S rRNA (uracil(1939)-C(5))-methyltransferase RlmD [Defluviitaleaceae bacterium]
MENLEKSAKALTKIQLVANCHQLDFSMPKSECAHVGRCGGCTYYRESYEKELAEKLQTLQSTLGAYGHLVQEVHPAPHLHGYRNKMELAFGDTGKRNDEAGNPIPPEMALGMRKKRSMYEVATTENCILMCDDFKKIAAYTLQFFRGSGEAVFHRKRHTGALRHLLLRRGEFTGELLVLLSTTSTLMTDMAAFTKGLRALPLDGTLVGILHGINDGVADAIKNENIHTLWGRNFYYEKLYANTPGELIFAVSAFSFFQTNSAGAQKLYDIVRDKVGTGALAYDLYCGTGTIAQVIAPAFERVVGIELIPEAIEAAKNNAQSNGITHCEFHAHDITVLAAKNDALLAQPANGSIADNANRADGGMTLDAIVVDPPRDGLSPKALFKVAAMDAERIVYVACKPASLARDLPVLVAAGYHVVSITGVDMFPRTPHVEAVALLQK